MLRNLQNLFLFFFLGKMENGFSILGFFKKGRKKVSTQGAGTGRLRIDKETHNTVIFKIIL